MKINLNILILVALFIAVCYFVFKPNMENYKPAENQRVENIKHSTDSLVKLRYIYKDRIVYLDSKLKSKQDKLKKYKEIHDTLKIIQEQDTIIKILDNRVFASDSLIKNLTESDSLKTEAITILSKDNDKLNKEVYKSKKVKRRLIITAVVEAGLITLFYFLQK